MSLLIKPYISHFRFKLQSCLSDQKSGSRLLPRKTIDEKKDLLRLKKLKYEQNQHLDLDYGVAFT